MSTDQRLDPPVRTQRIIHMNVTDQLWDIVLAHLVDRYPLVLNKAPGKENLFILREMDGWNGYYSKGGDKDA